MFVSALGAIVGGELNRLRLPRVDSALVVLVDGLGFHNLRENLGHARHLSKLFSASGSASIRCGFPSTTAVSLTSFGTGLRAGTHGILGYQVLDSQGSPRNMLNGWSQGDDPRAWQPNQTVAELATSKGVRSSMVAASEYRGSGFTNVIMGDVQFIGEDDLGARAKAADIAASTKGSLVYLYFAELDQAAHRFGVESDQWFAALESIDQAVSLLGGRYGLIVTADHGVMNVHTNNHTYLDEVEGFTEAVTHAMGDPRALFCYGDINLARTALEAAGVDAHMTTISQAMEQGWVSGVVTTDRLPDFVIVAKGDSAFYDRRTAKPQSLRMIGQHGGVDDRETRVPLIRGGLFA